MSPSLPGTLLAAVLLVATILWEMQAPVASLSSENPQRSAASIVGTEKPDTKEWVETWMSTALERPLLSESRRRRSVIEDVTANATEGARLTGIITGPSGSRAIFKLAGATNQVVLKEGMRLDEMTVHSIGPGQVVVVVAGGTTRVMKPSFDNGDDPPHR